MPIPEGAHRACYEVSAATDLAEVAVSIQAELRMSPALADETAQAAADAVVAHLQTTFQDIGARRWYECNVHSQDWPPAEGGE